MEKNTLKRVLQINAGSGSFGGVSAFIFNVYSHIDTDSFQFDFLSPYGTTYSIVEKQIQEKGGHIYDLHIKGSFPKRTYLLYRGIQKFIRKHSYDLVHIHSGSIFFNYIVSSAVRKHSGIPVIIHSHNGRDAADTPLRRTVFNRLKKSFETNANLLLACSKRAAAFMFTKKSLDQNKVRIIYNGIDTGRFMYNPEIREKTRKELGITDSFVIGHIGRFVPQKNQLFLIDVFKTVHETDPDAILLIYGNGPLKQEIIKKIHTCGLDNHVKLCEPVQDIEKAYMAMDAFVLTSLYEGLPVTAIEAQTASLPVIMADTITPESRITDYVSFLSLDKSREEWAAEILKQKNCTRNSDISQIIEKGYDIRNTADSISNIYTELTERDTGGKHA